MTSNSDVSAAPPNNQLKMIEKTKSGIVISGLAEVLENVNQQQKKCELCAFKNYFKENRYCSHYASMKIGCDKYIKRWQQSI